MRLSILFTAVFLLCSSAGQGSAVSSRSLTVAPGKTGFTVVTSEITGVNFTNRLEELASARNRTLENGAGLAAGDFDGDGDPDIFLCDLSGRSALYENLGGWRFRDATAATGLPERNFPARGAVLADINGDARVDLLLATIADGVRIFTNSPAGKWIESTDAAGTRASSGATTLALADVDRNGTIDLYVTTYRADDIRDRARIDIQRVGGKISVAPALRDRIVLTQAGLFEFGEPDILYLNDGRGHFTVANDSFFESAASAKPLTAMDWGLAASFRDLNMDGWPDLYVCNDYWTPDRFWLNAAGRFYAAPHEVLPHTSENSMGVDFADINADGHTDIFVTDMLSREHARRHRQALAQAALPAELAHHSTRPHHMQNMLFLNRGDGTYAEIAGFAGVLASEWSWQPVFVDIDLDAYPDLLIPAGHTYDVQDMDATEKIRALQHAWPRDLDSNALQLAFTRELLEHRRLYPPYDSQVLSFRNNHDLTFTEMTQDWTSTPPGIHQGIAGADFDGDGDVDFVVNKLNSAALFLRNNSSAPRVKVQLHGRPPNTEAIGAKVIFTAAGLPTQSQEVVSGGRYLSGFATEIVFAAVVGTNNLRVIWPDSSSTVMSVEANHSYQLQQPNR